MPRPKNAEPSYLRHKPSGRAYCRIDGQTIYLGPHGSEESLAEYRRVVAEWKSRRGSTAAACQPMPNGIRVRTVDDLIDAFWVHAEQHYRHPDGRPTSEQDAFRQSLKPLRRLYGTTLASAFGPVALEAVQQAMVDGSWANALDLAGHKKNGKPVSWSRKMVNQRIGRVRRVFKWGARKQLIPFAVYDSLRTVPGLQRGRTNAREYEDVPPVSPELVEKVFPHFGATVQAMIRVQQWTGLRPGEVCAMRPQDIDQAGIKVGDVTIWVYRPTEHKGAWRGHKKATAIGPRAQEIIRPFLQNRDPGKPLFSPAEEVEAIFRRRQSASRFPTRRGKNCKSSPRRRPSERYTVSSYGRRIRRVCRALQVPDWHPHQLRHLVATEVEQQFGLDGARAVLDHKDPKITLVYAQRSLKTAAEIVAKIG